MAIGDVPLTPIIDTVTGSVTEIGRIFLRTLTSAVGALAPIDAQYWVSQGASVLTADVNLGALPSGYLRITSPVGTAIPSTVAAIPLTDVTGLAAALALKAPLASPAFTGAITMTGAGPSVFSGAVTGAEVLRVTNTAAGAGNSAQVAVGNDAQASLLQLLALSSTYTPISDLTPNAAVVRGVGTGGLAVSAPNGTVRCYTGALERLRIVGTGEVLINTTVNNSPTLGQLTVATDPSKIGLAMNNTSPSNTLSFVAFYNNVAGVCGYIGQASATTVVYTTTSDGRLKDDLGVAHDLTALRAVTVHDFTWKADGVRARGVFAQEAAAVFPRAILAGTDETIDGGGLARPWSTDYSQFVPDLIVGWQQHDAALAALRAAHDAAIADLRAATDAAIAALHAAGARAQGNG